MNLVQIHTGLLQTLQTRLHMTQQCVSLYSLIQGYKISGTDPHWAAEGAPDYTADA